MAEQTLLGWSGKQAAWVRDALRRHAQSTGASLSDEDKTAIVARVRHYAGFAVDPAPTCSPFDETHLKGGAFAAKRTEFCSLGPVENLNRLAPGQKMSFATNGITLIYGDNGSGKSGYARVTKKICRSLSSDDLLSNVFEAGAKPAPRINVRYRVEGDTEVTETTWVDGTPSPLALSQISVFDSQNARLYVDRQNRIGFLPTDIALLQRHSSHCSEMDAAFKKETANIEKRIKVALPSGYTPGGEIAKLLLRLDVKSKDALPSADEIKKLAEWTEAHAAELKQLNDQLASDPAVLAGQRRRAKAVLEGLATSFTLIESALSKEAVEQLSELHTAAKTAAEAAALAASDRFASYPIEGVGQSPWELMYNYAKAFAESQGIGKEKLPDEVGAHCVLCQEPLTEAAAERVKAFNDFIAGTASKAALVARQALEKALADVRNVEITTLKQAELNLGEYSGLNEARKSLAKDIISYCEASTARRNAVVAAGTPEALSSAPGLPKSVGERITTEIVALEAEAKAFDEAANKPNGRATERARIAELEDRKRLADSLDTVLARRDDLDQLRKLVACSAAVGTLEISRQITSLRRSLVMEGLEKRIFEEIKALDLTHIPFSVSDNSQEGQSLYGVAVKALKPAANNKVLSEGEQRALALACFLGEVSVGGVKHGLIIDDPVSSLDHTRIRRVAERLVAEAQSGRQVIVFTHNILFFNEVREAASRATPQVPVLPNYISKSAKAGFGIVSQSDEPWVLMSVNSRINLLRGRLKDFGSVTDIEADDWRRSAKDFYTDLRETWERLVEEALLYKVVERFNAEVKTQSLKGVVVEDEDYKTIFWAMKRVSERSGHDMAAGKNVPTPKPADMNSDLDTIEAFRSIVQKRRKEAEERRKKLEDPPRAEVA